MHFHKNTNEFEKAIEFDMDRVRRFTFFSALDFAVVIHGIQNILCLFLNHVQFSLSIKKLV